MTTETEEHPITGKVISHWGTCPVCFKERRTTVKRGVMSKHRKWMSGFPGHSYGYMMPCRGSGQMPLPPLPTEEKGKV